MKAGQRADVEATQMNPIQKTMLSMLVWLRIGVGVAGLTLPFVLVGCGELNHVHWADSMSAYYHANQACPVPFTGRNGDLDSSCAPGAGPARDWFVGNLFFIGAAMFLIKGFSTLEDILLDAAGLFVIGVALISMPWRLDKPPLFSLHWFHEPCAILFFVCVGLTVELCSEKTLKYVPGHPKKGRSRAFFQLWYQVFAILMFVAPIAAFFVALNVGHKGFLLEFTSVWAFGLYWLFKTWELKTSGIERRAISGDTSLVLDRSTRN